MADLTAPRPTTVKKLFALSSNRCAFPTCQTPIVDPNTGTLLGEICHIRAQREGGQRFDPAQTSAERHALDNLVLMCGVHHAVIDADENVALYSVEHLLEIKATHEAHAQARAGQPQLTPDVVTALLSTIRDATVPTAYMDFRGAFFNAGGYGGGPGGGGGAGGLIHIVGVTPAGFREKVELDGKPGGFPGGGGGGGGSMVFSGRLVSEADIHHGLQVSAFLFTNAVEVRSNLLYALGAGWERCDIATVPADVHINLAAVIETGTILPNTLLALAVVVRDPSGEVATTDSFDLSVAEEMRPIMRQCFRRSLRFRVTQAGIWSISLRSGDYQLAKAALDFKVSA